MKVKGFNTVGDGHISLLPTLLFVRNPDHEFSFGLYAHWISFGFGVLFPRRKRNKLAICIQGHSGLLTKGRVYSIIKTGHTFYVVKRDDGSIDRMDKNRFGAPY
jgi:hypothetical protein